MRAVERLAMAMGARQAEVLLAGASVVNVYTGEVAATNVALGAGRVVGVGEAYTRARAVYDLSSKYLLPGFIDGHVHIESSHLTPPGFAEAVVPHGTTAVVADPHEIANVLGLAGVRYLLSASEGLPCDCFFLAPPCVPASSLETPGASLDVGDVEALLREPRVLGVAEVMDVAGLLAGDPRLLAKVRAGQRCGKVVDGHAPGLGGVGLCAYAAAGVESDHEAVTAAEGWERLSRGLWLMIREGSQAKNLGDLARVVTPLTGRRCLLVTDDVEPADLAAAGHMDAVLRRAVEVGLRPVQAVQMVTLNPAERFGLRRRGAVAPGHAADLVVVNNLRDFEVEMVFKAGRLVAEAGKLLFEVPRRRAETALDTIHVPPLTPEVLRLAAPGGGRPVRVIGLVPDQLVTRALQETPAVRNGEVVADPGRDLLKAVVVERHRGTGQVGLGLVQGFGLQAGAVAASVAHDAHNLVGVGADDGDLLCALRRVVDLGGGLAVARDGRPVASLALPVAGLMSDAPAREVAGAFRDVVAAARSLGARPAHPLMALTFLSLSVIPALRLTDRGLVDVERQAVVPLSNGGGGRGSGGQARGPGQEARGKRRRPKPGGGAPRA
jgi:adenine deaminase